MIYLLYKIIHQICSLLFYYFVRKNKEKSDFKIYINIPKIGIKIIKLMYYG